MEEILLKSSQNIQLLIETIKKHEENISNLGYKENDVRMCRYMECEYRAILNPPPIYCPLYNNTFRPEDKVIFVRECRHIFAKEPFLDWINFHNHCPRCNSILY